MEFPLRGHFPALGPAEGAKKRTGFVCATEEIASERLHRLAETDQTVNPLKALCWTAVINGLLAPFLLTAILIVASDGGLMQGQPSSRLGRIVVALATIAMFVAGAAMFLV